MGLTTLQTLPKGRRSDSTSCPLARALSTPNNRVNVGARLDFNWASAARAEKVAQVLNTKTTVADIWSPTADIRVPMPRIFRRFIANFDNGRHPSLKVEEV